MGHRDRTVHLATVSGVATTKPELIRWFENNVPDVQVITTKSFQVRPNPGNREPVICETSEGNFGNSVGLRNPGMEVALPQIEKLREEGLKTWLNVSVSADNPEDFTTLVRAFDEVADSIELNFSCPHAKAGFGASIGVDINIASDYVRRICSSYPDRKSLLFIKLTPNVDNIGQIAKAVIESGADGISAINTVGPIVHIDPVSGKPILQNALGGKGGKSGAWVFDRALEAIGEIRTAVGDDIPIIGMGGVSDGKQCALMIQAGADAVGIGSALAHVGQKNWASYFRAVRTEAQDILDNKETELRSASMLSPGRTMAYRAFKVTERKLHCEDTLLLTLDGKMADFKAGEFVFLWIPGVGEKPFSVAIPDPLTFIIKKRGPFTQAVFDSLNEGDIILLRGPYGAEADTPKTGKAIIL
ncbi:MAG: dihydroorotate dehydrogenase, partial [Spirochaetales bacterium]|nr:dihydroorotate dehydrogenase [Spirochaetales bacterium]